MKLPASSNSRTGGAALSRWSARTVVGRCRIQAWPRSSIDTLDTWPHTYLLGSLGQDGSTSNFGISRVCASAAFSTWPTSMATADTASRIRMVARIEGPSLGMFSLTGRCARPVCRNYCRNFKSAALGRFHALSSDDRPRHAGAQEGHEHARRLLLRRCRKGESAIDDLALQLGGERPNDVDPADWKELAKLMDSNLRLAARNHRAD